MNILFAASEAAPYIATGGLADVVGALPKALSKKGLDVRVILPLYKDIPENLRKDMVKIDEINIRLAWRNLYCGIFKAETDGIIYYFIDNEYYFAREGIYGFYDDCERFVYFSKAVLEAINVIDFKPDIINSNDWQTAMIPVYYNVFYEYQQGYEDIRNVFTIHNIQYQGKFGIDVIEDIMGFKMYHADVFMYDGCVNLLKAAIETADKITTVSPSYAWEILDNWYAQGLDRILVNKKYKLCGFLNGIDTDIYNPLTDKEIAANFSADDLEGKAECKNALINELGISENPDAPVVAIITRLVAHKGIDLIRYVFEDMIREGIKFAVLGSGEKIYEDFFKEMAFRYPDKVSVTLRFDKALADRIYAGADMFLMPSQSEPCGLAQMIAMRYGTIPIVREVGGLRDSVSDFGNEDGSGNGFTFKAYNANDMLASVMRAKDLYDNNQDDWQKLMVKAMNCDFSWSTSAELYIGLYKEIVSWN